MKKVISILTFIFLFFHFSFSQQSVIKNYPLKDYKAPDIKYRQFDLGTNLSAGGVSGATIDNQNNSVLNASINYYEYVNTKKHQGISDGNFYTYYNYSNLKKDTSKVRTNYFYIDLTYSTQNRFYNTKKVFLGVHGGVSYWANPLDKRTDGNNNDRKSQRFSITPFISVGKGRVEPVESARRAMDILLSLERCNRLALDPDTAMIDSLSRVVNRIRFKRFFDRRFKRIYQLEELDQAIQNLDLVDSLDIVYFANLNDIWNYVPNFRRGSGTRVEGGIIPDFSFLNSKYIYSDSLNSKYSNSKFGIYGFFSFNRMRPISYAWQSTLMIDLTLGYKSFFSKNEQVEETNENESSNLKSLLNASWQFGFFPNTRTYAGITPFVGVSFDRDLESENNTFGVNSGFRFEMYYYVSPRLRFTFNADVTYAENFDFSVPTPFWNTVGHGQRLNAVYRLDDNEVAFPVESFNTGTKKLLYSGRVALTYAIF